MDKKMDKFKEIGKPIDMYRAITGLKGDEKPTPFTQKIIENLINMVDHDQRFGILTLEDK